MSCEPSGPPAHRRMHEPTEERMNRRDFLVMGGTVLASAALRPLPALAQRNYPDRPVKLIVPFAPGGASDVVGRLWADRMKGVLGAVGVENRASGGGALGTTEAARAPADGYTLLLSNTSTQVLIPALM